MLNSRITIKLLMLPIIWMGIVQLAFAGLSFFLFQDEVATEFFIPGISMVTVGLLFFIIFRNVDLSKANSKDALAYSTLTWVIISFLGAIPIMTIADINLADAVFESASGLTSTGATILSGLDQMKPTFLMFRQFLQWMGGLGIVIFVVAILPMLNVGGMRLLKSETPGPSKNDKIAPRVINTARYLWGVYFIMTILCIISFYFGGMTFYDAVAHTFSTVSTGGFSTHDASIWHYQSHTLLWICNVFMIAGAVNFAIHFRVIYKRSAGVYIEDEETRVFLWIILVLSLALAGYLVLVKTYTHILESISFSAFHIISFITSTGFAAASYAEWPLAAGLLLFIAQYFGGCAGSTAGGNKIVRGILTFKIIGLSIKQLINPNQVFTLKYQNKTVPQEIRNATIVFMLLVVITTVLMTLLLVLTGMDLWSAVSAVAACINVAGLAFGTVSANFQSISDFGIWVLSFGMILGRLEYFTVLALFSVIFWKR